MTAVERALPELVVSRLAGAVGVCLVGALSACSATATLPPVGVITGGPSDPPAAAPAPAEDMVRLPGGSFRRGHADATRLDETPPHVVRVKAFSIDRTLVTRAEFARFVDATGHVTSAEKAGFGVGSLEGMDDWAWERIPHGSWRRPFAEQAASGRAGEGTDAAPILAKSEDTAVFLRDDAPVVMVSWVDAVAYCAHRGARLPTEAEWEYAMRAGAEGSRFPWGDEPERGGKPGLNFWQGTSHHENLRQDGYVYVSPVRAFEPNAWGIHDPAGNVWQWVSDWYAPDTYARAAAAGGVEDPGGPETGKSRVLRGGSWWCGGCTCAAYGLFYRGKGDPNAAFNNNGFRCARD